MRSTSWPPGGGWRPCRGPTESRRRPHSWPPPALRGGTASRRTSRGPTCARVSSACSRAGVRATPIWPCSRSTSSRCRRCCRASLVRWWCCSTCRATNWTASAKSAPLRRSGGGRCRSTRRTVVANADDPLVVWGTGAAEDVTFVGVGLGWHLDAISCPACGERIESTDGDWWCSGCALRRPAGYQLDGDELRDPDGAVVTVLRPGVPGRHNLANAALAVVAATKLGVDPEVAARATESVTSVAGRYQTVADRAFAGSSPPRQEPRRLARAAHDDRRRDPSGVARHQCPHRGRARSVLVVGRRVRATAKDAR